MKDLKHLIFFENLLQDAQNELVEQAKRDGKLALGYNCYYIPEVLLNLPGFFHPRPNHCGAFGGRGIPDFGDRHRVHLHLDIDPIQQGTGNLIQVLFRTSFSSE